MEKFLGLVVWCFRSFFWEMFILNIGLFGFGDYGVVGIILKGISEIYTFVLNYC